MQCKVNRCAGDRRNSTPESCLRVPMPTVRTSDGSIALSVIEGGAAIALGLTRASSRIARWKLAASRADGGGGGGGAVDVVTITVEEDGQPAQYGWHAEQRTHRSHHVSRSRSGTPHPEQKYFLISPPCVADNVLSCACLCTLSIEMCVIYARFKGNVSAVQVNSGEV